jgi:hypothetical protein
VNPSQITNTRPVIVQIPDRINTVGLIDGQHRTFAYFEANPDDDEILNLRRRQNLLVTGIIYPKGLSSQSREIFEASLFLEINSTQTNAKSNLKQSINVILKPFAEESIATRVLSSLDRSSGPLSGFIERYWFDEHKLKTTSIVSFALKPLVKLNGNDTLFRRWEEPLKTTWHLRKIIIYWINMSISAQIR